MTTRDIGRSATFTVALVGADGAGKSTVGRRLQGMLPVPSRYVYMGVNLESSNLVLPTTRLWLEFKRAVGLRPDLTGPPNPAAARPRPKGRAKRVAGELKSMLRVMNLVAEEWFRQAVIGYHRMRGRIVVLDRDFYLDYYAHDIANDVEPRPLSRRLHRIVLKHLYRKPDFVICLDAPSDVLFARKREGTPASLESRRQEYLQLRHAVGRFAVVDATQPTDAVSQQVADLVLDFRQGVVRRKGAH